MPSNFLDCIIVSVGFVFFFTCSFDVSTLEPIVGLTGMRYTSLECLCFILVDTVDAMGDKKGGGIFSPLLLLDATIFAFMVDFSVVIIGVVEVVRDSEGVTSVGEGGPCLSFSNKSKDVICNGVGVELVIVGLEKEPGVVVEGRGRATLFFSH